MGTENIRDFKQIWFRPFQHKEVMLWKIQCKAKNAGDAVIQAINLAKEQLNGELNGEDKNSPDASQIIEDADQN